MVEGIDELYGLPLADFTTSRNELAARAAARGDKARARAIKALRKPNVVAWTLNQLSRRRAETIERLVATYAGPSAAHSAESLRSVADTRRQLVAELMEVARDILEETGSTSPQATLQRVSQALYSGGSEEDQALLLQGRLVGDMGSPNLDFAFGPLPVDVEPDDAGEADEHLQTLTQEAEAAERSAADLEEAAAKLDEMAEAVRARLAEAEEEARAARVMAETARRLATEAAGRLAEARDAAGPGEAAP